MSVAAFKAVTANHPGGDDETQHSNLWGGGLSQGLPQSSGSPHSSRPLPVYYVRQPHSLTALPPTRGCVCVGAGNYFGTAELQVADQWGVGWSTIATLSGSGSCATLGPTGASDDAAYSYFRFSIHGNGRSTYHHFAGLQIDSLVPPVAAPHPELFQTLVASYSFSSAEVMATNAPRCTRTHCPEIWSSQCAPSADELDFGDLGTGNGASWIQFTMKRPVAVASLAARTARHPGGVYARARTLWPTVGPSADLCAPRSVWSATPPSFFEPSRAQEIILEQASCWRRQTASTSGKCWPPSQAAAHAIPWAPMLWPIQRRTATSASQCTATAAARTTTLRESTLALARDDLDAHS